MEAAARTDLALASRPTLLSGDAPPDFRDVLMAAFATFLGSLAIFLWGVQSYAGLIFDESWWVPTARRWLAGEMTHQEHPALAKMLISVGIAGFGDNPFGWRVMSALFASLTLVAMLVWALALFRNLPAALWVVAITFLDQVVYIQARIAMLDIFLIAFCTIIVM